MKSSKAHLVLTVAILTIIALCAFVPAQPAGPKGGIVVVPGAPPQIEWETYPVGGMILVNPDPEAADSLGNMPMVKLPEGAMLGIPHVVKDTTQTPRSQS